ncbi:hypothetical protein K1719_002669 [Acacia pycnantha]|nr:hypothetical protein K1719_002669 [Acacia pycnantha]
MLHPVPLESTAKGKPPPYPGDDRSTKKVKLGDAQEVSDTMEEECAPSLHDSETHVSANLTPDLVPETPLATTVSPLADGNLMNIDNVQQEETMIPSFKDKLLNNDRSSTEEEEEVILQQGDVIIGMEGSIPTVNFATHVLDTLNKKMGYAVVVKLLGRKIGYRHLRTQVQNIWKPTSNFKLTDLDDECFLEHVINQVVGWVRLPKLPTRYYRKNIIRSIGRIFGEVIRVDYNTESGDRGKFARLAVVIDLTEPLTSKILVDGEMIYVEYEGLPTICYNCGRYGHLQEYCPEKMIVEAETMATTSEAQTEQPTRKMERELKDVREQAQFGEWMQVQRRRRTFDKGDRRNDDPGQKSYVTASRYEVLNRTTDLGEEKNEVYNHVRQTSNGEATIARCKPKEQKSVKKMESNNKQKENSGKAPNKECIFNSAHYVAMQTPTTLEPNYNSAIIVNDDRQPPRKQAIHHISKASLGQPSHSKAQAAEPSHVNLLPKPPDPKSQGKGVQLSSGLALHNIGGQPNISMPGPSLKTIKEIARGLQHGYEENSFAALVEGVDFDSSSMN